MYYKGNTERKCHCTSLHILCFDPWYLNQDHSSFTGSSLRCFYTPTDKLKIKYFSLTFLIRCSLFTFRTYMKIWWCFGSYLCRNIDNSKGLTNFQAALYIWICIYFFINFLIDKHLYLWWQSWIRITLVLHDPSAITIICWFVVSKHFLSL